MLQRQAATGRCASGSDLLLRLNDLFSTHTNMSSCIGGCVVVSMMRRISYIAFFNDLVADQYLSNVYLPSRSCRRTQVKTSNGRLDKTDFTSCLHESLLDMFRSRRLFFCFANHDNYHRADTARFRADQAEKVSTPLFPCFTCSFWRSSGNGGGGERGKIEAIGDLITGGDQRTRCLRWRTTCDNSARRTRRRFAFALQTGHGRRWHATIRSRQTAALQVSEIAVATTRNEEQREKEEVGE